MKHYLFAKFFTHLSANELMDECAKLGIDGPTLLIRDGYWVSNDNMETELEKFINIAIKTPYENKICGHRF